MFENVDKQFKNVKKVFENAVKQFKNIEKVFENAEKQFENVEKVLKKVEKVLKRVEKVAFTHNVRKVGLRISRQFVIIGRMFGTRFLQNRKSLLLPLRR